MDFDIDEADAAKLMLRVTLGALVLLHGVDKIMGGIVGIQSLVTSYGLPEFVAYGVYLGEVLGPILIILGLFTRVGAGLIVINMLFTFGLVHVYHFFTLTDHGSWEFELQGMYLFTALALTLLGSGRLAVRRD